jgi:hypothetical protein
MWGPGRTVALALVMAVALMLGGATAFGATGTTAATGATRTHGTTIQTGAAAPVSNGAHSLPTMSLPLVRELAGRSAAVRAWIHDHPVYRITPQYDPAAHQWTVYYVSKNLAGVDATQAEVLIDDRTSEITETRTGPQVAWMMARGYWGSFGRHINDPWLWTGLCLLFVIPLVDIRRLVSWRTLDLLALIGFSISLVWFNDGQIYTSVPLVYPPMVYLGLRMAVIGTRRARSTTTTDTPALAPPRFSGWAPIWVLIAVLALCVGLRYSLNGFDSNVIDVGYAGVIGAHKIVAGVAPYGHFPSDCGQCDTYGPATYLSYVPFEVAAPWTGHWDTLPAAHAAASVFDGICLVGMLTLGWRLSGLRLGLALATAWAAFPFTAYALESNSNDELVAAALIWGLVLFARPIGRGLMLGLAIMAKFTPAILLLAWWRHPFPKGQRHLDWLWYLTGLVIAAWTTAWVILLDGFGGIHTFWARTVAYQVNRTSPFSIWGQHPDLRPVQLALIGIVGIAAVVVARWPRERDFRTVAALSGALLIGLQLTMTYWFYLYIPWFLPFVLVATVPDWTGSPREGALGATPGGVPAAAADA